MTAQQAPMCEACSMPMQTAEDHGGGDTANPRCKYCTHPDGSFRTYEEVYEGLVQALMAGRVPGFGKLSREEAEKRAHYIDSLPAWAGRGS
jgi:hypothetical protein